MPELSRPRYDAIIVGGSFAGLSAAMQLGRARRRVLVIDAGQPRNRFAHASHGFLGQDGRTPAEILATGRKQVLEYPTVSFRNGIATGAVADGDAFHLTLDSGAREIGRRLILASGIIDELPPLPGLGDRWGATVLHCPYCHGYEVADRRLGVLAVGEGSVHQALLLPDWSADVVLFTNDAVELSTEQRVRLVARGVKIESRPVIQLAGDAPSLTGVVVQDERGNEVIGIDALFVGTHTHMASSLAQDLGCEFDDGPFGPVVRTDAKKQTSVLGVFAAGDSARAPHNVTWASADGVAAGIYAHQSLVFEDAEQTLATGLVSPRQG